MKVFLIHQIETNSRKHFFINFLAVPLLAILLFTCSGGGTVVETKEQSEVFGSVMPPLLNFYKETQTIGNLPSNKRFIGYNEANNSLDFFAINENEVSFQKSIQFQTEGPERIDRLSGFYYVNKDSIFLFSRYQINLVNEEGERYFQIDPKQLLINHNDEVDFNVYSIHVLQENGLSASYVDGFLYLPLNYFEYDFLEEVESFGEDVWLLASYNLRTEEFLPLPIRYPDIFRKNLYGFGTSPQFYYTENSIIYSFLGFPEVYVFDIPTSSVRIIKNENSFPLTTPLQSLDASQHLRSAAVQYSNGVLSANERYLYQAVILPRQPGDPQFIYLRTTDLKEGTATITDFPKAHAFMGMLAYKDGLYLPQMSVGEDSIGFSRLIFD